LNATNEIEVRDQATELLDRAEQLIHVSGANIYLPLLEETRRNCVAQVKS
jgi:hypothetical protein